MSDDPIQPAAEPATDPAPAPETARRIEEEFRPALRRTGKLESKPVSFVARSGEIVDCISDAIIEYDPEGQFLRTIAMYAEVTDQARAAFKYRDLYRSTPAMLHTLDADGHIQTVTDHWLQKLGYKREEVLGRPITDFYSNADRRRFSGTRLAEAINRGNFTNVDRQMVTKDGRVLDIVMSSISHRDARGNVDRLLVDEEGRRVVHLVGADRFAVHAIDNLLAGLELHERGAVVDPELGEGGTHVPQDGAVVGAGVAAGWAMAEELSLGEELLVHLESAEEPEFPVVRLAHLAPLAIGEVERRGMPMEIALLPLVESALNPFAVSSQKAAGLWQIMPATAKHSLTNTAPAAMTTVSIAGRTGGSNPWKPCRSRSGDAS